MFILLENPGKKYFSNEKYIDYRLGRWFTCLNGFTKWNIKERLYSLLKKGEKRNKYNIIKIELLYAVSVRDIQV